MEQSIRYCEVHKREATHTRVVNGKLEYCCDPQLGGIMIPCVVKDIKNEIQAPNS